MIAYAITDLVDFSIEADMIVYRDKSNIDYASNAKQFIEQANKLSFSKILLHTDYKLAYELEAGGIHLTSTQFKDIEKSKALGLFVVISTHTLDEAQKAESLGADMVTFSPIFATPNKGEPKGVEELREVVSSLFIPVIALGGIVRLEHIEMCKKNGAKGFASIRYFINKSLK